MELQFLVMNRLLRYWTYFRRAHSTYTAAVLSMINFATVTYTLLFSEILGLPKSLTWFVLYFATFLILYVAIATAIGWWDYRRGSMKIEAGLIARANPYTRDLSRSLMCISNAIAFLANNDRENALRELEEARRILSKWIEE